MQGHIQFIYLPYVFKTLQLPVYSANVHISGRNDYEH